MLAWALEPILVMVTIYLSVVYGLLSFGCKSSSFPSFVLYITLIWTNIPVFEAFPIIFIDGRGFTIAQDGLSRLVFIGAGISTTSARSSAIILQPTTLNLPRSGKDFHLLKINRLFCSMIGTIPVIGIFGQWLGWTGQYANIPWYVPALSTTFLELESMSFLAHWQLINIPTDLYSLFSNSRVASSIHPCKSHRCIWFNKYISHFLYRL